jgi:hypothetical protein
MTVLFIVCGSRKTEKSPILANKEEDEEEKNIKIFYNTTPLYVPVKFFLHSNPSVVKLKRFYK